MHQVVIREQVVPRQGAQVQLRPAPYPYRAILSICSDLDGTQGGHCYAEIMRFLNTTEMTPMGPGVGLEVGNSIFFRTLPHLFAYWSTTDAGRAMARALIHSGHIDCLHSFGEFVSTRDEAARCLDELERHDCRLEVWVDHGGAATNFGTDIMQGHGDEVGHPAYHADLTARHGIKYICCGRVTSIVGQDVRMRLGGILRRSHPVASGRALLKEAAKQGLARVGNEKYAIHRANETLRQRRLRDGRPAYEFLRCNPHWGGVSRGAQGRQIGDVLTADMLNRLVRRGGTCILYTHLGRVDDPQVPFDARGVAALRRLAEEFHAGRILVTTTRRLLGYRRALREIACAGRWEGGVLHIEVETRTAQNWVGTLPRTDWAGLTFYVPEQAGVVRLTIDGQEITDLRTNARDHTGHRSVSVPWPALEFPRWGA